MRFVEVIRYDRYSKELVTLVFPCVEIMKQLKLMKIVNPLIVWIQGKVKEKVAQFTLVYKFPLPMWTRDSTRLEKRWCPTHQSRLIRKCCQTYVLISYFCPLHHVYALSLYPYFYYFHLVDILVSSVTILGITIKNNWSIGFIFFF